MEQITLTPTQEILDRWPTRSAISKDLGVNLDVVSHWYGRSSIPAKHFMALMVSARRRKIRLSIRELVEAKGSPLSEAAE
jgi:hypothetical protein